MRMRVREIVTWALGAILCSIVFLNIGCAWFGHSKPEEGGCMTYTPPEIRDGLILDLDAPFRGPLSFLRITIGHGCKKDDSLILKEVKIHGPNSVIVKSYTPNAPLKPVGNEFARLSVLAKKMLRAKTAEEGAAIGQEAKRLSEEIGGKEFSIKESNLDLREFKDDLKPGDEVLITVEVTYLHRGKLKRQEKRHCIVYH